MQAVKQFLKGSTESDEFALISFSDRVVLESDFTTDAGAIRARLMGAASHGRTALLDAVERAASLVRRTHNQRRVILVVSAARGTIWAAAAKISRPTATTARP